MGDLDRIGCGISDPGINGKTFGTEGVFHDAFPFGLILMERTVGRTVSSPFRVKGRHESMGTPTGSGQRTQLADIIGMTRSWWRQACYRHPLLVLLLQRR